MRSRGADADNTIINLGVVCIQFGRKDYHWLPTCLVANVVGWLFVRPTE